MPYFHENSSGFCRVSAVCLLILLLSLSWSVYCSSLEFGNRLLEQQVSAQSQNPCIIPTNSDPIKNATISSNDFLLYENLPFGVSIEFPKGMTVNEHIDDPCKWTQDPDIYSYYDIARISFSDQQDMSGILLTIGRVGSQSLDAYLDSHIQFYADTRENFRLLQSDMNSVMSNNTAYMIVYTNVENGDTVKMLEVGSIVNKKVFYVQYFAPIESFSNYLPTVYNMVNSFKILESVPDLSSVSTPSGPNDQSDSALSSQSEQFNGTLKNRILSYSHNRSELGSTISESNNLVAFKNPQHGIEMLFPESWKEENNVTSNFHDIINIIKFESMARVPYSEKVVLSKHIINEAETLDVYTAKKIQSYKQDPEYLSFSIISTNLDSELLGLPAYELVYTTINPHGGTDIILNREIGTMIGDEVYYATYSALISRYSQFQPLVEKMIDSIKLNLPSLSSTVEQELKEQQQQTSLYVPEI